MTSRRHFLKSIPALALGIFCPETKKRPIVQSEQSLVPSYDEQILMKEHAYFFAKKHGLKVRGIPKLAPPE